TPMTEPRFRHRLSVVVATACSSWSLVARTPTINEGNEKPWPRLESETQIIAVISGVAAPIEAAAQPPRRISMSPIIIVGFRRLVYVIKKPVETLDMVTASVQATILNPDSVGVTSLTAWKYNGMLKIMVLIEIDPRKFPKMILARGCFDSSEIG